MRVIVHSLGCRVNHYESEVLAQRLNGVDDNRTLHLVNTCIVTSLAERKGRKLVRRLRREAPESLVVAVGCQATLSAENLVQAGADLVVPNHNKSRLPQLLAACLSTSEHEPACAKGQAWPSLDEEQLLGPVGRTRAVLKVQDGCAGECSYCLTRRARGPLRSKNPEVVIGEARRLVAGGHKELVLTGVNLGQYGSETQGGPGLSALLEALVAAVPEARFRLSSLGPEALTERLIEFIACTPRVCPHLHLPLQSGDDRVLRRMRRPYTAADYRERVRYFLDSVPAATFGTDVMTGFPGEDTRAHRRTVQLLHSLKPLNTHIFRFSPRPGTEASQLGPLVPKERARARAEHLDGLTTRWSLAARESFLGVRLHVLVERLHSGTAWGHSENYLYVGFTTSQPRRGTIAPVRIVYVDPTCTMGVKEYQRINV
ncbi:MAG: MiaB/RimO family radical SAM methylthiotransferase [Candidatus Bipolaricaulota bacterium]